MILRRTAGRTGGIPAAAPVFRGAVSPPARFIVVGRAKSIKPRRTKCDVQGFVGGVMVFEAEITGMPL